VKIIAIDRNEIGLIKPLWEKLNAHHLAASRHFKEHYAKFTFEKRMEDLKKRDRLIAYVAQDNGENIGYCVASVDALNGEIDSLFVEEAYRGKGVGEKLASSALIWLEEKRCVTKRVSIAEGNEDALKFYKRFGFAKRLTVMQMRDRAAKRKISDKLLP